MDNYSAIGFFNNINLQVRNLKANMSGGSLYQNLMPVNKLIPHSFSINGTLSAAILTEITGAESFNITAQYSSTAKTGYTVYSNAGSSAIAINYKQYYVVYTISGVTYYSDVVTFCPNVDNLLKLEWFHLPDSGELIYSYDPTAPETANGSYDYATLGQHTFYFNEGVFLGKPNYEYEENIETRISKQFPITETSFKRYNFKALLPEYVLDVLRLVKLHSNVVVTNYDDILNVNRFLLSGVSWVDNGGYLGDASFEFRTSNVAFQHAKFY